MGDVVIAPATGGDEPGARGDAGSELRRIPRRWVLAALVLTPAVVAGCSSGDTGPDPLVALAAAARADAALAATTLVALPELAERVEPLRAARAEHAAALEAEILRLDPGFEPAATTGASAGATPAPAVPADAAGATAALRDAVRASAEAAAAAALDLPVERAGLVGSISACCATYVAGVLV